jgi:hypothetical protein
MSDIRTDTVIANGIINGQNSKLNIAKLSNVFISIPKNAL